MRGRFAAFYRLIQEVARYAVVAVAMVGFTGIVGCVVICGCAILDRLTGTRAAGLLFGLTIGSLGIVTAVYAPVSLLQRKKGARGLTSHQAPSEITLDLPARMGQVILTAPATPRSNALV